MDKDNHQLLFNFYNFLNKLEDAGLILDGSGRYKAINNERNMIILGNVIDFFSKEEIFIISEELKLCKTKADIIDNKRFALKGIDEKIKEIKNQLDIE